MQLSNRPVVIALHFVVEDLALARVRGGDQVFVDDVEDVHADVLQLLLHLHITLRGFERCTRSESYTSGLYSTYVITYSVQCTL